MEDNKEMILENEVQISEETTEMSGEFRKFEASVEFGKDEGVKVSAKFEGDEESVEFTETENFGETEASAPRKAKKKTDWKKELREWVVSLAAALLIALVVRYFLFTLIRVDGDSMYRTLHNGERLFVTIADVKLFGAERGDVVICRYPNRKEYFVKRVVGVPGDQVERVNGVTWVIYTDKDGQTVREPMDEDRSLYYPEGSPTDYEPYTLGEDEFFVVGDNRYNSHDSRDWKDFDDSADVGPITGDMLVGQARFVLWPFDAIRSVK